MGTEQHVHGTIQEVVSNQRRKHGAVLLHFKGHLLVERAFVAQIFRGSVEDSGRLIAVRQCKRLVGMRSIGVREGHTFRRTRRLQTKIHIVNK